MVKFRLFRLQRNEQTQEQETENIKNRTRAGFQRSGACDRRRCQEKEVRRTNWWTNRPSRPGPGGGQGRASRRGPAEYLADGDAALLGQLLLHLLGGVRVGQVAVEVLAQDLCGLLGEVPPPSPAGGPPSFSGPPRQLLSRNPPLRSTLRLEQRTLVLVKRSPYPLPMHWQREWTAQDLAGLDTIS